MKHVDTKEFYFLGLDVSTKCIGVSLFNNDGKLYELTHIIPKVLPIPETKTEELFKKANLFAKFIEKYKQLNIKYVLIEEPLLKSNNAHTAGTLIRFNGIISKIIYDSLSVVPEYVTTYEARKNAFPELMQPNAKGNIVLFGAHPQGVDKKRLIWEKVAECEPQIKWLYDKKGQLKKENFDMADSYAVTLAFMRIRGFI